MAKRCKSIGRALRRGHPVNGDYFYSKTEARILKEKFEAAMRKKEAEQKEDNQTKEKEN